MVSTFNPLTKAGLPGFIVIKSRHMKINTEQELQVAVPNLIPGFLELDRDTVPLGAHCGS